jgi:hypothetical protein
MILRVWNQVGLAQVLWMLTALAFAGVLGQQIASLRTADRTVQVRGAAELPVVADLATWTLNFSTSGNDLAAAQQDMAKNIDAARTFLTGFGLSPDDIDPMSLSVSDAQANPYNQNATGPRFTLTSGVAVRTSNLEGVAKAKNNLGQLVGGGVVLTGSFGPNFTFSKLNEAKPQLISRATAEARKAADQFAADSGAQLGAIRRARQGSVEILGRDSYLSEAEQANKVLRVVTVVDYELR